MKGLVSCCVSLFLFAGCLRIAQAQDIQLKLEHLDKLAAKAEEVTDVNLDGPLLHMATKFFKADSDEADVQKLISGLKGVYVKSFEFAKEGSYSDEDVASIVSQIHGAGWKRMVTVKSKREHELTQIFTRTQGDKISGLIIVSAEPKELTVVNIVGAIDVAKLSELERRFGIPDLGLDNDKDSGDKPKQESKREPQKSNAQPDQPKSQSSNSNPQQDQNVPQSKHQANKE
jgi:uncharacterized protein DUF4252